MSLQEVWDRYEHALEARPSKGDWTAEQAKVLADSVSDIPGLVKEVERLEAEVKKYADAYSNAGWAYENARGQW